MSSKNDAVCELLKKHAAVLTKDSTEKINLFDAYLNGNPITSPRAQSIFRSLVKSVDKSIKVSFSAKYNYMAVLSINPFE